MTTRFGLPAFLVVWVVAVFQLLATSSAHAQTCTPHWGPVGIGGGGLDGLVSSLLASSYTGTPSLYAGGFFENAAGVPTPSIARWDGVQWSSLGLGLNGEVKCLAVFDDGTGPALYAGGTFTASGSTPVPYIARWSGTSWQALGQGPDGPVYALCTHNDGSSPALYAAGYFNGPPALASPNILRWRASGWSGVGGGVNRQLRALAVYNDGNGDHLFVGGHVTVAGSGVAASGIAKWDGAGWSPVGGGTPLPIHALAVYDDGTGSALYAGGEFSYAGGATAIGIARWNGATWSALGGPGGQGTDNHVDALAVLNGVLYVGGKFGSVAGGTIHSRFLAAWNGTWQIIPGNPGIGSVTAIAAGAVGGAAPRLFFAGVGPALGATPFVNQFNGASIQPVQTNVGGAFPYYRDAVRSFVVYDSGAGPSLYAAGQFHDGFLARWTGNNWQTLGGDLDSAYAAAVFEGKLYVVFQGFFSIGGKYVFKIASWDGKSWAPVGGAFEEPGASPRSLAVFDDGSGPALYVGGRFTVAGGVPVSNIAKWNGSSWSSVGSGVTGPDGPIVRALQVFDDGTGAALYAAGKFSSAGGIPTRSIARWNGTKWTALNDGLGATVSIFAMTEHNNGDGPALYAAGFIPRTGTTSTNVIRFAPGKPWTFVGYGLGGEPNAMVLYSFNDGRGSALYCGGNMGTPCLSRVTDGFWTTPLGTVIPESGGGVYAMTSYDLGHGQAVLIGGALQEVAGIQTHGILEWLICPCYANCDGSTSEPVLNVLDFRCFLDRFAAGDPYANCDGSSAAPVLTTLDFTCFLQSFVAGCS